MTKYILLFLMILGLNSCFVIRKFSGADVSPEQFDRARTAKMMQVKASSKQRMLKSMANKNEDSDIIITMSADFLNKIVRNYNGAKGYLDARTSYTVKDVKLSMEPGAAVAVLDLHAYNDKYSVYVDLKLDCLLNFEIKEKELLVGIEPFNISPDVSASGALSIMDDLIADLIKVNIGGIDKGFPPMKLPIDFSGNTTVQGVNMQVRDKINMNINSPEKHINYKLKLKDIWVFADKAVVPLNVEKIELK